MMDQGHLNLEVQEKDPERCADTLTLYSRNEQKNTI